METPMRRPEFAMTREAAVEFLRRAPAVQLATTTPEGEPVLRTLNAAILDDLVVFHGSVAGEKARCLGRAAVVQADETVASIPSYFVDPVRACPATTYYRGVQVHGILERIDDLRTKAAALSAFMDKYQPEGGHAPISAESPLYGNALRGILVFGVRLERITGKAKLGQHRKASELTRVVEALWRRGRPGDPRAIELVLEHNGPEIRPPRFTGPGGALLSPALDERDLRAAVALLSEQYWYRGADPEVIARAQLGSAVWIGARSANGELLATARANTDGVRHAYVADVAVAPAHRGRGLGRALVELLLDHPRLREVESVRLGTADASEFYAGFGFEDEMKVAFPYPMTRMLRQRSRPAANGS